MRERVASLNPECDANEVFPRRLKPLPAAALSDVAEATPFQSTDLLKSAASPGAASRRKRTGEEGYVLIAVLFLIVMILIALSIAAPKVAADIERDREIELQHRGMQYRRAIQLYYKKFAAYPPNMEALEKSNEIRFLRKRYKDPATGKDEWHLIHFGEAKTPTAMGFFGQPLGLGGQTLAGTGPGGVGQNIGTPIGGSTAGGGLSGGGAFGGSPVGGSPIGGSPIGGNTTDPNAGNAGGTTTGGSTTTGTSTDPNSTTGSTTGSSSSISGSSSTTGSGQTFGGGGIIGVESTSPKATILEYKKKKHFNEWEFVYDPAAERLTLSNNTGAVGQPIGGAGNGGTGSGTQPVVPSPGLGNQQPPTVPTPQQPNQPQQ